MSALLLAEEAVALVITLIMLSVITVVVVAFLALAMHDRRAAGTTDKMTRAQLMADAGRARAIAEIQAQMLEGYTNGAISLTAFDVMVSYPDTNVNGDPYRLFAGVTNFRDGTVFGPGTVEADTNLTFLDLNRNGFYDPPSTNGNGPGDPEWIGVAEKPGPLGEKNQIIGRYAYYVQPAGKSLDLNFIHNQAKQAQASLFDPASEGHLRGSGLGSWELNLASFLVDLNTNVWPVPAAYSYMPALIASRGSAFWDAFDFLRYRYAANFTNLANAPSPLIELEGYTNHWAGSDNERHYYDPGELFNTNRPYKDFINRLEKVQSEPPNGDPTNDYNRQTFYRLLSQMGMDSVPDLSDKINLNYIDEGTNTLSNYVPWSSNPTRFFNLVAARLLKDLTNSDSANGLTNHQGISASDDGTYRIPIYPITNNCYTPAVHRLMQLTANIYDATQESPDRRISGLSNSIYPPTVFRPMLEIIKTIRSTNIAVVSYVETNGLNLISEFLNANKWHDLNKPVRDPDANDFVFGVPLIIGVKKGYPNFNEFVLDTGMVVQRRVEMVKIAPDLPPYQTNQMYSFSIANRLGIELWNSYTQAFPYPLRVKVKSDVNSALTDIDSSGTKFPVPLTMTNTLVDYPVFDTNWQGKQYISVMFTNNAQFTNLVALPSLPYKFATHTFGPSSVTEKNGLPVPEWTVAVSNRLWVILYDPVKLRVVDAVGLAGLGHETKVLSALTKAPLNYRRFWDTNRPNALSNTPTAGLQEQIDISIGAKDISDTLWRSFGNVADKPGSIQKAKEFVAGGPSARNGTNLVLSLGFTPATRLYLTTAWQANDPLLHSTAWDLMESTNNVSLKYTMVGVPTVFPADVNLGQVNPRYRPWYHSIDDYGSDPNPFDLTVQDPMVRGSDDWDFPESKFPSVGWLGGVHRGTPWQTVYFKAEPARMDTNNFRNNAWFNQTRVAYMPQTHPTNDWRLVDLFTTAPNTNATRGTLSINQTNQAAWSAVFGGLRVVTNSRVIAPIEPSPSDPTPVLSSYPLFLGSTNVVPASPELTQLVQGIDRYRNYRARVRTNSYDGIFNRLSELLAVPELSVNRQVVYPDGTPARSPFLYMRHRDPLQDDEQRVRLTDAAYEWLPRHILSLLRVGEPRVVIYAYGQSLEPYGPDHMDTRGPTNYRVTAEYATRTVVRYDLELINRGTTKVLSLSPVIESFNILSPE